MTYPREINLPRWRRRQPLSVWELMTVAFIDALTVDEVKSIYRASATDAADPATLTDRYNQLADAVGEDEFRQAMSSLTGDDMKQIALEVLVDRLTPDPKEWWRKKNERSRSR